MDPRLEVAPVVAAFAESVSGIVAGLYIGGSLATADYRPGVSDIDAVAMVDAPPRPTLRTELTEIHRRLTGEFHQAQALHCVYVPVRDVADVTRSHWTWAFDEFFRRPLSGIARAELLADPIVLFGPSPSSWLPPMSSAELRDAARAELAGCWSRALRKRAIWLQDVYVDLGLTVWARADATITDGVLITKTEAIARMTDRGVPAEVGRVLPVVVRASRSSSPRPSSRLVPWSSGSSSRRSSRACLACGELPQSASPKRVPSPVDALICR